ncbi:MAG: SMR family transporter [Burkholderiales bacterium]
MTGISLALILVAVLLGSAGQLLLKAGVTAVGHFDLSAGNVLPIGLKLALQPAILGGISCYVMSLALWIVALSRVEVSVAYPMVSLGYALTAVAAWWLLGESLTPMRLGGIGLIILGVAVVAKS